MKTIIFVLCLGIFTVRAICQTQSTNEARAEAAMIAAEIRLHQAEAASAASQARLTAALRKKAIERRAIVWAKVSQCLRDGLLIDADSIPRKLAPFIEQGITTTALPTIENDRWRGATNVATGTILLMDYPRAKQKVDGDEFAVVAFPCGKYEYISVTGAKRTVRRYTTDLNKAANPENFTDAP
jgi:hypothetical protein